MVSGSGGRLDGDQQGARSGRCDYFGASPAADMLATTRNLRLTMLHSYPEEYLQLALPVARVRPKMVTVSTLCANEPSSISLGTSDGEAAVPGRYICMKLGSSRLALRAVSTPDEISTVLAAENCTRCCH